MIQEAYVSYETAKLLKEKRFDEIVDYFYTKDGYKIDCLTIVYANAGVPLICRNQTIFPYKAPTQQMAMRWLREVHNRYITILTSCELDYPTFIFRIERYAKPLFFTDIQSNELYNSYEDAVEAAIKYCLTNLI